MNIKSLFFSCIVSSCLFFVAINLSADTQLLNQGKDAFDSGDYKQAWSIFYDLASKNNDPNAQYWIGYFYEEGRGSDTTGKLDIYSLSKAKEWYQISARNGFEAAKNKLAESKFSENNLQKEKIIRRISIAADKENSNFDISQNNVTDIKNQVSHKSQMLERAPVKDGSFTEKVVENINILLIVIAVIVIFLIIALILFIKEKSDDDRFNIIYFILLGLLLLAIFPFPIGFYTLLRLICGPLLLILTLRWFRYFNNHPWIFCVLAILTCVYNPIFPVYLGAKEPWIVINFISAVFIGYCFWIEDKNKNVIDYRDPN